MIFSSHLISTQILIFDTSNIIYWQNIYVAKMKEWENLRRGTVSVIINRANVDSLIEIINSNNDSIAGLGLR